MTKYNIRLRRKSLSQGQIERHKDFRSLRQFEISEKKPSSVPRIVLIVVAVLLLVLMVVLGVNKIMEAEPKDNKPDSMEVFDEFKQ